MNNASRRAGLIAFLVIAAPLVGCGGETTAPQAEQALNERELGVKRSYQTGVAETSGLAWRPRADATGFQLLSISDREPSIIVSDFDDDFQKLNTQRVLLGDADEASQWEAIAVDAEAVYVLDEQHSVISVFDAALEQRLGEISLSIPDDDPIRDAWDDEPNSRGEGMVLLNNGHLLVAKEKRDALIIEFGPAGDEAEGYRPQLALGVSERFSMASESMDLVPLSHWRLKRSQELLLRDFSDLTVGPDGRLFLLSDKSRALAQLERVLSPDEERIDVKAYYNLPRRLDKPEGLTFPAGKRRPVVAIDKSEAGEDVFVLSKVTNPGH